MRYIFENGNSNEHPQIKNNSKYTLWMHSILRRSKEIGKVELPICSIILDERGRCIGRGVNKRNINKDPLGHAEIMACLLYTSPSPRDTSSSRMPSSA